MNQQNSFLPLPIGQSMNHGNPRAITRHNPNELTMTAKKASGWMALSVCHPELVSGSVQCRDGKLSRKIQQKIPRGKEKWFSCLLLKVSPDRSRNKFGMTVLGFTMAEILLSLTIIGVVAAITLPSLTGNINERTWNTQRKALYARMSQAIALMPNLNGYGVSDNATDTENQATETFITNGLAKVLKINNICDSEHLTDCGIPSKITALNGSVPFESFPTKLSELNSMVYGGSFVDKFDRVWSAPLTYNTKTAAFETANGESIAAFYNPNCQVNPGESYWSGFEMRVQGLVCANFIYDLNGTKGPNTVGKDIGFMSALYAADPMIAAPVPLINQTEQANIEEANRYCRNLDAESRVPNAEELISMFYNVNLIDQKFSANYFSGKRHSSGAPWLVSFHSGGFFYTATEAGNVRCVKR